MKGLVHDVSLDRFQPLCVVAVTAVTLHADSPHGTKARHYRIQCWNSRLSSTKPLLSSAIAPLALLLLSRSPPIGVMKSFAPPPAARRLWYHQQQIASHCCFHLLYRHRATHAATRRLLVGHCVVRKLSLGLYQYFTAHNSSIHPRIHQSTHQSLSRAVWSLKRHIRLLPPPFRAIQEYIVRDKDVLIVDTFSGRVLEGRRYSDGLHQCIEAKEGETLNGT